MKLESDINYIVRRGVGPIPPDLADRFVDMTGAMDLHQALTLVRKAEAAFMELPGEIRAAVRNDPVELVRLLEDPSRVEEARALGLVVSDPQALADAVRGAQAADSSAPQPGPEAAAQPPEEPTEAP